MSQAPRLSIGSVGTQDTPQKISWTDDLPVCHMSGVGFSTNQSYREDGFRQEDHEFEDRSIHFRVDDLFLYGVFDGHHGSRASDFTSQRMPAELCFGQIKHDFSDEHIIMMMHQAFHCVEKGFYDSIDDLLAEKAKLLLQVPENIRPYELQTQYPEVWERNQELERRTSGGTTAVVALMTNNKLFIANTGCSRALLCVVDNVGILRVTQLSVDHCIGNSEEDNRLEHLGIPLEMLASSKILGDSNCTRTIGDHSLKTDFRSVEFLRLCSRSPLVAEPSVSNGVDIGGIQGFLVLISNGLCKTLEDATGTDHVNKDIAVLVAEAFAEQSTLNSVAQSVVDKVVRKHHDTFMSNPDRKDLCRKRKDMTLLIRNFNYPLPHSKSSTDVQSPLPPVFTPGPEAAVKSLHETIQSLNISTFSDYSTNQSEDEQHLFMCQQTGSKKLELDEDGRVKLCVDFTEYYNTINALSDSEKETHYKNVTLKPVEPDVIQEETTEDKTDEEDVSTASSSLTPDNISEETTL